MKKFLHGFITIFSIFMLFNVQLSFSNQGVLSFISSSYATGEDGSSDVETEKKKFVADTKVWGTDARTKVNIEQYGSLLLMLAMAGVAAALVVSCQHWGADTIAAAAGAGIYIAQEIYSLIAYKADLNYEMEYEVNVNGEIVDEGQYQAIENQRDLYKKMATTAMVKAIMQDAAAAAFATAAIIAGTRYGKLKSAQEACKATISNAAQVNLASCVSAKEAAVPQQALQWSAYKAVCDQHLNSFKAIFGKLDLAEATPATHSLMKRTEIITMGKTLEGQITMGPCVTAAPNGDTSCSFSGAIQAGCRPYLQKLARETMTCNSIQDPVQLSENKNEDPNEILDSFKSLLAELLLIKPSFAEDEETQRNSQQNYAKNKKWVNLAGIASWGIAILIALKKRTKEFTQRNIATHPRRIIMFSVFAALSGAISAVSWGIYKTMKENERILDGILNRVKNIDASKLTGGDVQLIDLSNVFPPPEEFQEGPITEDGGKAPCLYGGDGKGNCLDGSDLMKRDLNNLNLDTGILGAAKWASKIGDSISGAGKLSHGNLKDMNNLGKSAKRLSRRLDGMLKNLTDISAKAGQPVDYKGLINRAKAAVVKSSLDQFKSAGKNPFEAMGALGAPKMSEKDAKKVLAYAKQKKENIPLTKGKGVDPFGQFREEKDPLAGVVTTDEKEQEYEIPVEEVNQSSHGNIFKLIHTRYLKTAYPVLFEKEKL